MTVTATIISNELKPGGIERRVLVFFEDDIDDVYGRDYDRYYDRPAEEDIQAWANTVASNIETTRGEHEREGHFDLVRQGQNATTLVWLRNTVDIGDEYILKGASNRVSASEVSAFAHIHRDYPNQRITGLTGLTNQERQQWSGQVQNLEQACDSYQVNHVDNPDVFFFDEFPEE